MDLFKQRLLAEGVRAIEGDTPSKFKRQGIEHAKEFEKAVFARANRLDNELLISPLFEHFSRITQYLYQLLALFVLLLGASSVQQLFFTEKGTQINFFWAFALFFIPNLLSLCVWLLLFFRTGLLNNTWLAKLSLWLLTKAEKRFNPQSIQNPHFWSLFKCFFSANFSGVLGKYQLSVLSHLLWLSYFLGATLMLVLMLATHQVDFIWQTSILSLENFQWLTQLLAYIPHLFGLPVPDPATIQQSNITIVNNLVDAQQSRFAWSILLIGSLLIYGLLPRLILWWGMRWLLNKNQSKFQLNLSSPYYVQLRQQLNPSVTSLGVHDPDLLKNEAVVDCKTQILTSVMPTLFFPVAIELSEPEFLIYKQHVEQCLAVPPASLTNICDFQAQQILLQKGPNIIQPSIVLYVSLSRVPDRGLSGFIQSLTGAVGKDFYLLLIDSENNSLTKRRGDWYALAERVNISLDNIIHLTPSDMEASHE